MITHHRGSARRPIYLGVRYSASRGRVPTIPSRGSLLKRVLINLVPAALPEPNNNHPPSLAHLATNGVPTAPWPRLLLWLESPPTTHRPPPKP